MSGKSPRRDRRWLRTRTALVQAFNRLVLARPRGPVAVRDVVAEADVGRSTFYDHFHNIEALRLEALSRPLAPLADAAAGRGDPAALAATLGHFWENRRLAGEMLEGRSRGDVERLLRGMIEQRLPGGPDGEVPPRLVAAQLAAAALAPLHAWLRGEAWCPAEALAERLCRSGEMLAAPAMGDEGP